MVSYQPSYIFRFLPEILTALPLTLLILVLSILFGSLLGGIITRGQLSQDDTIKKLANSYIFVIRCTPPVVLLFLVFYGLPEFLKWWLGINVESWSRANFTLISMVLLFAATSAEIFKSAYLAIPYGQTEAGLSIGLNSWQTFFRIIFPQAFRVALPNLTTAILNLMKDMALAYTIGLVDIMGQTNLLISRNMGNYSLEAYTAVAIIYWGLALLVTFLSHIIEKNLVVRGG